MSTPMKYALAAGAGYALHAFLQSNKRETSKVYTPTPIVDDSLVQKVAGTVATHLLQKFLWPDKPASRYEHTYANFQGGTK
jgi:hypothetical protein